MMREPTKRSPRVPPALLSHFKIFVERNPAWLRTSDFVAETGADPEQAEAACSLLQREGVLESSDGPHRGASWRLKR
jgi:hypothetical protein